MRIWSGAVRLKKRLLAAAALLGLVASSAFGQSTTAPDGQTAAGGKMDFDVASVKRNVSGEFTPPNFFMGPGDSFAHTGSLYTADYPLAVYIMFAYDIFLTTDQMDAMLAPLPKWVATDDFDLQARASGNPTKDQVRLMMRSLLEDRFKLKVHTETREVPVLALTLVKPGKPGPQIHPHAEGPACPGEEPASTPGLPSTNAEVFPADCDKFMARRIAGNMMLAGSRGTTVELIGSFLASIGRIGRPVIDQTGLHGKFDFTMEWTPDQNAFEPPTADDLRETTFLQAIREQLGMKLSPTKAPQQVIVVDHVERPSEN